MAARRRRHNSPDVRFLLSLVAILWILEILDHILPGLYLDALGIQPRNLGSIPSIILAPFLHGNFAHLSGNTIGLLLFGGLATIRGGNDLPTVTFISALASGCGVWILGSPGSLHIGASGIVFGFFAFTIGIGVFEKRLVSVLLSLAVLVLWGGLVLTLLELRPGISWTGHLFGFIGGILAAREVATRRW